MLAKFFVLIIVFYQKAISPFTIPACRFTPTCSEYSLQSFKKFGLLMGLYKSIFRILRCNPLFKGGYDPVD